MTKEALSKLSLSAVVRNVPLFVDALDLLLSNALPRLACHNFFRKSARLWHVHNHAHESRIFPNPGAGVITFTIRGI